MVKIVLNLKRFYAFVFIFVFAFAAYSFVLDNQQSNYKNVLFSSPIDFSNNPDFFWYVLFTLVILSILVLILIWFVYKRRKIESEPGRNIQIVPRVPTMIPSRSQ